MHYSKAIIQTLASDSFKGRDPQSPEIKLTLDYIEKKYSEIGLRPYSKKKYLQKFQYQRKNDSILFSYNIIGFLKKPSSKKKNILICAHYDHLGLGGSFSRDPLVHKVHNGADDNASGIAMMLNLAKALKKSGLNHNILFIAWGAHETGLFGSAEYAQCDLNKQFPPDLVINLDMVGRLDTAAKNLIIAEALSIETMRILEKNNSTNLNYYLDTLALKKSDLKPFYEQKIPVVGFSTGITNEYHSVDDDEEKINYLGMEFIFDVLKKFIIEADKKSCF